MHALSLAPDAGLVFREIRRAPDRLLAAKGPDGSLYCFGAPERGAPSCAWRQTPAGDRLWLAYDTADQHSGTQACKRAASALAQGRHLATMAWPIPDSRGILRERRVQVAVERDAAALRFEPLAHGAEPYVIATRSVPDLLAGRMPAHLPGLGRHAEDAARILLTAARDAPGVLRPGERLRAGASLALLACEMSPQAPERRLLERTLGQLCSALCPMLEFHAPHARILDIADEAVKVLSTAPRGVFGPAGRAWLSAEALPVIGLLRGRLAEREAELAEVVWAEPAAPAFA